MALTTLPTSCADCLEIRYSQPPGTPRACPGLYWDCCTFLTLTTSVGTSICWAEFDFVLHFLKDWRYLLNLMQEAGPIWPTPPPPCTSELVNPTSFIFLYVFGNSVGHDFLLLLFVFGISGG